MVCRQTADLNKSSSAPGFFFAPFIFIVISVKYFVRRYTVCRFVYLFALNKSDSKAYIIIDIFIYFVLCAQADCCRSIGFYYKQQILHIIIVTIISFALFDLSSKPPYVRWNSLFHFRNVETPFTGCVMRYSNKHYVFLCLQLNVAEQKWKKKRTSTIETNRSGNEWHAQYLGTPF